MCRCWHPPCCIQKLQNVYMKYVDPHIQHVTFVFELQLYPLDLVNKTFYLTVTLYTSSMCNGCLWRHSFYSTWTFMLTCLYCAGRHKTILLRKPLLAEWVVQYCVFEDHISLLGCCQCQFCECVFCFLLPASDLICPKLRKLLFLMWCWNCPNKETSDMIILYIFYSL